MKRALLTLVLAAVPLAAFAQESVRLASFDQPIDEVYTTLIELAIDKGYASRSVSPLFYASSGSGKFPRRPLMPLLGTHLSVQVAGQHVDLYVRHQNHHSFLLAAPLNRSIRPATRRLLEAFVKTLRSRMALG